MVIVIEAREVQLQHQWMHSEHQHCVIICRTLLGSSTGCQAHTW